jgi:ubiquinone/menaquinone biosynthesis C-methylase UbiE
MNKMHMNAHKGLIHEISNKKIKNVLEVACGTGWNIPYFRETGLTYYGLDISDTAIAVAALKYPEELFLNIGINGSVEFLNDHQNRE